MDAKSIAIKEAKLFSVDLEKLSLKPDKVMLFGSFVNGHQNTLSDIDLAVWSE